jgi:hypothetical protein
MTSSLLGDARALSLERGCVVLRREVLGVGGSAVVDKEPVGVEMVDERPQEFVARLGGGRGGSDRRPRARQPGDGSSEHLLPAHIALRGSRSDSRLGTRTSEHRPACLFDLARRRPLPTHRGKTRCDTNRDRHARTFEADDSRLDISAHRLIRDASGVIPDLWPTRDAVPLAGVACFHLRAEQLPVSLGDDLDGVIDNPYGRVVVDRIRRIG